MNFILFIYLIVCAKTKIDKRKGEKPKFFASQTNKPTFTFRNNEYSYNNRRDI